MGRYAIVLAVTRAWIVLLCAIGCMPSTDVVVSANAKDVVVPGDLDTLRFVVTNPEVDPTPIYTSADLPLCAPGATGSCYSLPISLTLYPGTRQPDTRVRVELDALLAGQSVIRDASVFSFTRDRTERLDFFLSKGCLMTACAATDLSCDRFGACTPLGPMSPTQPSSGPVELVAAPSGSLDPGSSGIPAPPSITADDLVLIAVWVGGDADTIGVPSDWHTLGELFGNGHSLLAAHNVAPSETSTYAFTASAVGTYWHMAVFHGVDQIEGLTTRELPAMTQQLDFPPVRTTAANALVVLFAGAGACAADAPAQLVGSDSQWTIASYAQAMAGDGMSASMSCAFAAAQAPLYELALTPR
jgi:hypothetical protein